MSGHQSSVQYCLTDARKLNKRIELFMIIIFYRLPVYGEKCKVESGCRMKDEEWMMDGGRWMLCLWMHNYCHTINDTLAIRMMLWLDWRMIMSFHPPSTHPSSSLHPWLCASTLSMFLLPPSCHPHFHRPPPSSTVHLPLFALCPTILPFSCTLYPTFPFTSDSTFHFHLPSTIHSLNSTLHTLPHPSSPPPRSTIHSHTTLIPPPSIR